MIYFFYVYNESTLLITTFGGFFSDILLLRFLKIVMDKRKIVIVTGASSGIGLACAKEFASRGYKLVLAARNIEKLAVIEKEIRSYNEDVIVVKTDVSIEEGLQKSY